MSSRPAAPKLGARSRTKSHAMGLTADDGSMEDSRFDEAAADVRVSSRYFTGLAIVFQAILLVFMGVWFNYPTGTDALESVATYYPYFRDVFFMIFFGFGFLMSFLRRYGFSAVGYTLLFSALTVQWSLILEAFFETMDNDADFEKHHIGVFQLLNGLFCSGAVLISFGAVLGKVSPLQLLILVIVEPIFFWLNIFVCSFKLGVLDVGGGYYIHMLGAYTGLVLTWFLTNKHTHGHPDNTSNYSSDMFALAGSLFLWILWPSFNAAIATPGEYQLRAIVNTFLSLSGSTVAALLVSRLTCEGKFEVVHVQNASLAGGVAMGIVGDLNLHPVTAVCVGFLTGAVSVLGYVYLTPLLNKYCRLQDICGVHNLHGMPSIIAAITGIVATAASDSDDHPKGDSQWAFQLAAIFITLGFALAAGLISGVLMWLANKLIPINPVNYFNDRLFWNRPSDYEYVVRDSSENIKLQNMASSSDLTSTSNDV